MNETVAGVIQKPAELLRRVYALPRLMMEVKAHLPVIPVLSRQLQDASRDMEQEIGAICQSFQEMATLAKDSMRLASVVGNGQTEDKTVNSVIQECRSTMSFLLERLEKSSTLYSKAISQMESVNSSVKQVFTVLEEVEKASLANQILALNAKIEAVHLGQQGSGFEVVAEQISIQATQSNELTERVAEILNGITTTMQGATSELKSLAADDRKQVEVSKRDVETSLVGLEFASSEMQKAMNASANNNARLVGDISKAVISLQFQDRVSQRIGHVIESLDMMDKSLTQCTLGERGEAVALRTQQVKDNLLSSYTMESERAAHGDIGDHAAPADNDSDVELF